MKTNENVSRKVSEILKSKIEEIDMIELLTNSQNDLKSENEKILFELLTKNVKLKLGRVKQETPKKDSKSFEIYERLVEVAEGKSNDSLYKITNDFDSYYSVVLGIYRKYIIPKYGDVRDEVKKRVIEEKVKKEERVEKKEEKKTEKKVEKVEKK